MTTATARPKISALAPWYGGNRMLAEKVGEALDGCEWVGIPFAGGMCEIGHITARELMVNDLHRDLMNLASVIAARDVTDLQVKLRAMPFHPDTLAYAQSHCEEMRRAGWNLGELEQSACERWAVNYFIVVWMTRSGQAGTNGERAGKLALRWSASGGGSVTRYHSAIDSLPYWQSQFQRCQFSTLDCFDFLAKCKDRDRHGIYCDPPFPGPGDKYTHRFDEDHHARLAELLSGYERTRIVCRFYDHPLIRELYPGPAWTWCHLEGRKQTNDKASEVLLTKNAN